MDSQLKKLLNQTLHVATLSSRSASGDPTYSTPVGVPCRVEVKIKVVDMDTKASSSHKIFTEGAINLTDRIWMPGVDSSDATKARKPLSVDTVYDPTSNSGGISHYETLV